jgi:hypothetical protein
MFSPGLDVDAHLEAIIEDGTVQCPIGCFLTRRSGAHALIDTDARAARRCRLSILTSRIEGCFQRLSSNTGTFLTATPKREKTKPRQASLRRAISTAYYALFNLLIREAASNWKNDAQRMRLARSFEHGKMKVANSSVVDQRGLRWCGKFIFRKSAKVILA